MANSSLLKKIRKKVDVSGISSDSRYIKKNYVFFAISGYSVDGTHYIDDAIKKNASAIVTSNHKILKKKYRYFM